MSGISRPPFTFKEYTPANHAISGAASWVSLDISDHLDLSYPYVMVLCSPSAVSAVGIRQVGSTVDTKLTLAAGSNVAMICKHTAGVIEVYQVATQSYYFPMGGMR